MVKISIIKIIPYTNFNLYQNNNDLKLHIRVN